MKYLPLAFIVISLSCSAPISYVNNVPRTSMLEEKGDVYLKANLGPDPRGRAQIIQFGGAWSPIQHFGLDIEYSTRMNLFGRDDSYDKIRAFDGHLVYFIPFDNESNLEFKLGYGTGMIEGSNGDVSPDLFNLPFIDEDFIVNSKFNTLSGQVNYNFYDSDDQARLSFGMRGRRIEMEEYFYQTNKDSVSGTFSTYSFDPFIEINKEIGSLSINSRLSYSFLSDEVFEDGRVHPHFTHVGFSLGLQYFLGKK